MDIIVLAVGLVGGGIIILVFVVADWWSMVEEGKLTEDYKSGRISLGEFCDISTNGGAVEEIVRRFGYNDDYETKESLDNAFREALTSALTAAKTDTKHPSWRDSIVQTPEWKAWHTLNEHTPQFDVNEALETGWMSPEHAAAFIAFVKAQGAREALEKVAEELPPTKPREDLSGCKDWWESNACGSCGEIRGRENGWNAYEAEARKIITKQQATYEKENN